MYDVAVVPLGASKKLGAVDLPAVFKELRRPQPDLTHTQDPRGRFLTYAIARALRIRTGHTFHMSPLFYASGPIKHRFFLLAVAKRVPRPLEKQTGGKTTG